MKLFCVCVFQLFKNIYIFKSRILHWRRLNNIFCISLCMFWHLKTQVCIRFQCIRVYNSKRWKGVYKTAHKICPGQILAFTYNINIWISVIPLVLSIVHLPHFFLTLKAYPGYEFLISYCTKAYNNLLF